jgi:hypothetical protein
MLATTACAGEVHVRACNDSDRDLAAFEYDAFDEGALAAGACTPYRRVEHEVYRYTYVRFLVGQDEFVLQPIDFVGETPLDAGEWSYHVSIVDFDSRAARVHADAD